MASPLHQSLDTLQPSQIGCISCDVRSLDLLKPEMINNFINRKQLSWKGNPDEKGVISGGFFELERRFLFDFETHFPSCEGAARASSNQLIQKLNFYRKHASPSIAREKSFKLSKGFLQGKSQWANIEELTSSPHTFFPLLVVINGGSGGSDYKFRLCQIPNRGVYLPQLRTKKTYNDFIVNHKLSMPTLPVFYLGHCLSLSQVFIDFQECFTSVRLHPKTALHNFIYVLKTKEGLPTLSLKDAASPQLHPLQSSTVLFGKKDGPFWSRQCVVLLIPKYREHHQGPPEDPVLLDDLERMLQQFSWVDDTLLPATTAWVLRWSESKGCLPPSPSCLCNSPCSILNCPTRKWDEKAVHQLDFFLEQQTNLYLSRICQLAVRVSHFSGYFVKCTQSPSPKLQQLLDQEISLKTPFDNDPRLLALKQSRPTQDQIRAEVLRGGHSSPLRTPLPSQGKDSEIMEIQESSTKPSASAEQLGKVYTESQVFLKTQSMYIAHFQGKAKKKSERMFSLQETLDHT